MMQSENQSGMQCVEVEALLAEAVDGALQGSQRMALEAHQQSCPSCQAMVKEAKAGMHWLKRLDEAEPPTNLVHNILAQTIGALPSEHMAPAARGEGWLDKLKGGLAAIFSPIATPRFAMSFGMAFFSITMLLGIAGFHMSDLRRLDLSSKGITKTYYATEARIVRYYENLRLVYEIESRVRDLRRAATPQNNPDNKPQPPPEAPAPGHKNPSRSQLQEEHVSPGQTSSRNVNQFVLAKYAEPREAHRMHLSSPAGVAAAFDPRLSPPVQASVSGSTNIYQVVSNQVTHHQARLNRRTA